MAANDEDTPLLGPSTTSLPRPTRNVTFDDNPVTRTIGPVPTHASVRPQQGRAPGSYGSYPAPNNSGHSTATPPMLAALNNRLRRRNSQGSMPAFLPASKLGPQRSSKTAQKLKLLPEPDKGEEGEEDEESGRDVYSQFTRIKDPTARRDAARLGKADRERLPRVTAYCTANTYDMELLMRFLKGRGRRRGASPKLIDECIYTPYSYAKDEGRGEAPARVDSGLGLLSDPVQQYERRHSADAGDIARAYEQSAREGAHQQQEHPHEQHKHGVSYPADDLPALSPRDEGEEGPALAAPAPAPAQPDTLDFDTQVHTPEIFLFDYGVVVIWGMSIAEERRLLKEVSKFEVERLPADQIETEEFNFYYTREYQPRIYNDFITLRDKHNYMTKLAISHALAQSVKTSLFEELIATTIETCKEIPNQISLAGKVALSRTQINMQIGELFTLRINIHLNGSVLDTPEVFWVEPQLEPVYQAVRSYLEMDQRVGLLTDRLDVIADLLAVMKDLLSHGHGEKLEWIVIILIAAEIFVALINIAVDLYVGI